ncbi:metallophosphoesterase family protein [Sphingobium yanoikuyae]|jgi:serine/threonine protein phosphatase 1|uniref:Serine/threonine protein phosphatase n=1 Tax=Sphingobium yanoikuyae TaxID=13690 RepID=A0A9X7YBA8_SPHYA|nr:metallophosphoesterase family protein [Sphingobium yanoikuyae]QNG44033.1 serine/threonine protein phosphatase [Sphingobium yanoikuyae]
MALPMLKFLRRSDDRDAMPPSVGDDWRIYAIGDIHGRLDLLDQLLGMLVADNALRPDRQRRLILLGDLIDRGPHSAQVIERVRALHGSGSDIRLLKGNHEEIFVMAARGDQGAVGFFRRIGGMETLASYGLPLSLSADMDDGAIAHWMLNHIPRADVDFLDSFVDHLTVGDYLFVHAGIRPRVPIAEQRPSDLRWIRGDFLNHGGRHDKMVVHGHSITPEVENLANRIGIDTGAYYSGRLTAIGLEGADRWFLQTGET